MPIKPSEVREWLDNGVMFAISVFVIWALCMGAVLAYRWGSNKVKSQTAVTPAKCEECMFAGDVRNAGDLVQHRLFGFIRLCRAFMIPNLRIPDPGRKEIFTDLLDSKFRIVAERMLQFLRDILPTIESMHSEQLANEVLSLVATIVAEYERECGRIGIPLVVLDRFREWHGGRITYLRSEVTLICESEWVTDPVQRLGFILSIFEQVMKATIFDAERTLYSLNGQLTGLQYKGFVVGPCPPRRADGSGNPPVLDE
jgi:hypothetical protein